MSEEASTSSPDAAAKAQADAFMADADLARKKGHTPEQVEARRRVAQVFCEMHLTEEPADQRSSSLAAIDFNMPVRNVNGRSVNLEKPKAGLLGLGHKKAYFTSKYTPKKPEDPIYALEYCPRKS